MRTLYSFLYTIAWILLLPYFLIAGLFRSKYLSSALERFGFLPESVRSGKPSLWIHAVSVGELLAAKPIIGKIFENYRELPIFISTTTITGQKLAKELYPGKTFYFPFDWKMCIRRVFNRLQPGIILILETEIWPNLLWEAQSQRIPILLVNGRISDRSFGRYRTVRRWLPSFTEYLMQTPEDARRMEDLGADSKVIRVMGNLKFDFEPPSAAPNFLQYLLKWKKSDMLWIAGSTMRGEEEIIIDAFQELKQQFSLKLMIAPRHPQRFNEVSEKLNERKIAFTRRSAGVETGAEVLLLDTIGELASAYSLADLVFIGGSLYPHGGHNPVEPAYYAKPIISGPSYNNFRSIFEDFLRNNAVVITEDVKGAAFQLLKNEARRKSMGEAGRKLMEKNRGAADFVFQEVRKYLHAGSMVEPNSKSFVR